MAQICFIQDNPIEFRRARAPCTHTKGQLILVSPPTGMVLVFCVNTLLFCVNNQIEILHFFQHKDVITVHQMCAHVSKQHCNLSIDIRCNNMNGHFYSFVHVGKFTGNCSYCIMKKMCTE